jgi:hypothetical protein
MRSTRLLALATGVAIALASGAALAQTLGEVAKKEEERRKTAQPAKVYTNKDLGSVPTSTPPPPAPAADSTADKSADKAIDKKDGDAKDKDKEPAKDKAYWASRKKSLQEALDRDQTYAEALQSRINALSTDVVNRDDPAQRSVLERDRQKAMADLQRLTKQIQDDKKALADLDEEARRAGVPPGWLR